MWLPATLKASAASGVLMKIRSLFLSLLMASAALPQTKNQAPGQLTPRGPETVAQQDPNKIVVTIGERKITAQEAAKLLSALSPDVRQRLEKNLPAALQQIVVLDYLANEAVKQQIDQQSPWKEQLEQLRKNALAQAYLAKAATSATIAPADVENYYKTHASQFEGAKVRGIYVSYGPSLKAAGGGRTEAEAKAKIEQLSKQIAGGGDFAELAKTNSDQADSAQKGGELGIVRAEDNLPETVKTAILKLKPGELSPATHVGNGYYLFKVDGRELIPLEKVRDQITNTLRNEKAQAVVQETARKFPVKVEDPNFFNLRRNQLAPAPAPPPKP